MEKLEYNDLYQNLLDNQKVIPAIKDAIFKLVMVNHKKYLGLILENVIPLAKEEVERGSFLNVEIPSKPFDFLHRRHMNTIPAAMHQAYGLPGIFEKMGSTNVFPDKGGDIKEADSLIHVLPDKNTHSRKASILLEQETGVVSSDKIDDIFDYHLFFTVNNKQLCIPYVATNHDYKENYIYKKKLITLYL